MTSAKALPEFPPHIDGPTQAFGTTEFLPDYKTLPEAYQHQQAIGCQIASTIFSLGWAQAAEKAEALYGDADGFELASPPPDFAYSEDEERDPVKRFQNIISAHLKSWEPKHEHKIAGVGFLIDFWCRPIKPKPEGE